MIGKEGQEEFKYECKLDESAMNRADKFFFWTMLYIGCGFWAIALVIKLFSANFFILLIPAVLACFNLYAFYNCSKGARSSRRKMARRPRRPASRCRATNCSTWTSRA